MRSASSKSKGDLQKQAGTLVRQVRSLGKSKGTFSIRDLLERVEDPRAVRGLEILDRIQHARKLGGDAPAQFIALAHVSSERLILFSCDMVGYVARLDRLPPLLSLTKRQRENFEIDENIIYWPDADFHFGIEPLVALNDPAPFADVRDATAASWRRFGENFRAMRKEAGLTQKDIEGVTERQVRRIERGKTAARMPTQKLLAEALDMTLEDFVRAVWA